MAEKRENSEEGALIYWVGEPLDSIAIDGVHYVTSVDAIPAEMGGLAIFHQPDPLALKRTLKQFYSHLKRWSWQVLVTHETPYSQAITDGRIDSQSVEQCLDEWRQFRQRLAVMADVQHIDALVGWLGLDRKRRLLPFKDLNSHSIYSFPLIEALYPDLYSSYRYVLAEHARGLIDKETLIDRIRSCHQCHSAHLNYVEVCPNCASIDIDTEIALHCFTCGHVGPQESFQRRGKLECPNCLTQLRHIGVDYDRPLENHVCHSCRFRFVEAETHAHCLSCRTDNKMDQLVVRKIYQYRLGDVGEYLFRYGRFQQAPQLSIKGKLEASFFQNVLAWQNKVAQRDKKDTHLLMGLHLPSLDSYGLRYGDSKLFALMDQLIARLGNLFRETDICCQFRTDVVFVLMPNTPYASFQVLQQKLTDLRALIEDDTFELNVYFWSLPDEQINADPSQWLRARVSEIYAPR
ncbi:diguanylate cyclase [Vibrio sp. SM6]|uniref:Diguanylate cyclase n=1 Tax=Vibrio agarilyticus TaxID=2726741 RepID=A0A7X8TQN9_9VIBR|nr:diguanylate cyclase [Vibrio agarilyticus]NLS12974.1 diguanylate cyclase [Vibrio agarilyticus]